MGHSPPSVLLANWDDLKKQISSAKSKPSRKNIHHLRVATQRFEAAVVVLGSIGGRRKTKKLIQRSRAIRKEVGALRDNQVSARLSSRGQDDTELAFTNSLKQKRKRLKHRVAHYLGTLSLEREEKFVLRLQKKLMHQENKMTPKELRENFDKASRTLEAMFIQSRKHISPKAPKQFHKFRLIAKKLRYIGEVQKSLSGVTRLELRKLELVQTLAGTICDDQVLEAKVNLYYHKKGHTNRHAVWPMKAEATSRLQADSVVAIKKLNAINWKK